MGKLKIIKEEESKLNLPLLYFDGLEDGDVFQYIGETHAVRIKDESRQQAFNLYLSFGATPDRDKPVRKLDATLTWREAE